MKLISIFLASVIIYLSSSCSTVDKIKNETLIVWNVGQGQMVTYISKTHCHHFDMGGEFFPKKKLFKTCQNKKNRLNISHWDHDHINFIPKARRIFSSLCLAHHPKKPPSSLSKKKIIQQIRFCQDPQPSSIQQIQIPKTARPRNTNESSLIFVIQKTVLIPGDSSSYMEAYWAPLIKDQIKILIVGHHGSRSSTSPLLLNHLPLLKKAIASARKKRYGHPVKEVVSRVRRRGVLFMSTERSGHIRISLKDYFPYANHKQ